MCDNSYGSDNGRDSAPIQGLSPNRLDSTQLYVQAVDLQFTTGAAQAFLQGLYPPYTLNSNVTDSDATLDPSAFVNDSFVRLFSFFILQIAFP